MSRLATGFLVCLTLVLLTACQADSVAVPVSAEQVTPLLPGMQAPAFSVRDPGGKLWRFDPARRPAPLVLSFYRGGWCPYCSRQLSSLRHAESTLNAMGYDVVFLSADRPEVLQESLGEPELGYRLYSDNDLVVARLFGIAFQVDEATLKRYRDKDIDLEAASGRDHHWLPVPATFVIGTDGMIKFSYVNPNYKERLHPELLVTAARLALQADEGL